MKRTRSVLAGMVLLLLAVRAEPRTSLAQMPDGQIVVYGVVEEEGTGRPLAGVQVVVAGVALGTVTDAQGRYLLHGVPNRNTVIRAAHAEYIPEMRELWVCTPILHPGGTCVAGPPEAQELRFFMRHAPLGMSR